MSYSGYPVITTPELVACRAFYTRVLGASVRFQSRWFLLLTLGDTQIGFVHPQPAVRLPVFRHTAPSRSLSLALEVEDIAQCHAQMLAANVEVLGMPESYPDGQLAFQLVDPAGTVISMIQAGRAAALDMEL